MVHSSVGNIKIQSKFINAYCLTLYSNFFISIFVKFPDNSLTFDKISNSLIFPCRSFFQSFSLFSLFSRAWGHAASYKAVCSIYEVRHTREITCSLWRSQSCSLSPFNGGQCGPSTLPFVDRSGVRASVINNPISANISRGSYTFSSISSKPKNIENFIIKQEC